MAIPVMPSTHAWFRGGPGLKRVGNTPQGGGPAIFASSTDEVWVWDEDTGERVTDLLDENAVSITAPAIDAGWINGVGIPVATVIASFSIGQFGKRYELIGVQTLKNAQASMAPTDTAVAALVADSGSSTSVALDSTYAAKTGPEIAGKVDKGTALLDVADYGAVGDGTTNDATAIQSALTAARAVNARLLLGFGKTYLINSGLNVTGCHVIGHGATLKHGAVTAFNMVNIGATPSVTRIEGLTLDGNIANVTDSGNDALGCGVYANVASWDDLTIRDCQFKDFDRTALYLRTPGVTDPASVAESRTMVDNCRFSSVRLGVYANQIKDLTVRDCRFESTASHAITANICLRPRITGNRVKTATGNGITASYCAYPRISDNTVDGATLIGIAIGGGSASNVATHHGTITGNTATGCGTHGIALDTSVTGTPSTPIDAWFTVTGNVCNDNTLNGIYVNNSSHVTINGNECEGNADSGIRVGAAYCSISGNECRGNNHGIVLNGNASFPNYGHHRVGVNLCSGNTTDQYAVESASVADVLFASTTATVPTS